MEQNYHFLRLDSQYYEMVLKGRKVIDVLPALNEVKPGDILIIFDFFNGKPTYSKREARVSKVSRYRARENGSYGYTPTNNSLIKYLGEQSVARCLPGVQKVDDAVAVYEKKLSKNQLSGDLLGVQFELI